MRRDTAATITSALLLGGSVLHWQSLFLFSKVVYLPAWTAYLPSPIYTPAYLAFLCLLPATLASSTLRAAFRAVVIAVLSAPLPALALYAANGQPWRLELWANVLFNYVWVLGFHCAVPAAILLVARSVGRVVKGAN
jgi:hypothetical protein